MNRVILILSAFMFYVLPACCQKTDSLFTILQEGEWVLSYKPKTGENLFQISKKFNVPSSVLAEANGMSYQEELSGQKKIVIPIGEYNFLSTPPVTIKEGAPLYYKTQSKESFSHIARISHVAQSLVKQWNQTKDNEVSSGVVVIVGWLRCNSCITIITEPAAKTPVKTTPSAKQTPEVVKDKYKTVTTITVTKKIDTMASKPEAERNYLKQTDFGNNVTSDKGTVAFFNMGSMNSTTYYAFHNTASKGSIIKVFLPGSDKSIYAKVIGPIPTNKQYYNSVLAISSNAKTALGINDNKAWCEFSYATP
jgi:LysM repeat protein